MEDLIADKVFIDAVEISGRFTVQRLPSTCQATHVISICKDNNNVIPIKLCLESKSQRWNFRGQYVGIIVLWLTSQQKVIVCQTEELTMKGIRTKHLMTRFQLWTHDDFVQQIVFGFEKNQCILKDVLQLTKHKLLTRAEAKQLPSTHAQEAAAQDELVALLGADHYVETPEKCRADASFFVADPNYSLPIQTKSCSFRTNRKGFNNFNRAAGYQNMLLFCRPMPRLYIGTVILPSVLAPDNICLTLSKKSKYVSFIVPDTVLSAFLTQLHKAVENNQQTHIWPSGVEVDISDLKLVPHYTLCVPPGVENMLERKNFEWRLRNLPSFHYDTPKAQGTTVDVLINGVRVQDKSAFETESVYGLSLILKKNNGRKKGKYTSAPYAIGDFDAVFAFPTVTRRYFFLIPAEALISHNVLSNGINKGKTRIRCYLPNYSYTKGPKPDLWTQNFCFDLEDQNMHHKVALQLESCKRFAETLRLGTPSEKITR